MDAEFDPNLKTTYELADLKLRSSRLLEKIHQFFFVHYDYDSIAIMHAVERLEKVCQKFLDLMREQMDRAVDYSEVSRVAHFYPQSTPKRNLNETFNLNEPKTPRNLNETFSIVTSVPEINVQNATTYQGLNETYKTFGMSNDNFI